VPSDALRRRAAIAAVVAGVVSVIALALVGVVGSSGPSTVPLTAGGAPRVLLISIPGLQWRDLDGSVTPHLDALLAVRAIGSVRTVAAETSTVDGYLTVGAGNRLAIDTTPAEVVVRDGCVDPAILDDARDSAEDQLSGAEPGALGAAVRAAGGTTAVVGSDAAVLALMGADGCVDVHDPAGSAPPDAELTLVELSGLERDLTARDRQARLAEIDTEIAALTPPPLSTLVLVVAPAAPQDRSEVTAFGASALGVAARQAPDEPGLASSSTTRRAGYVTMPDIAPTVLTALGIAIPDEMSGTPIRTVSDAIGDDGSDASLADLSDRIEFRDRAVGPVAVVFVAFIAFCGLFALARRGRVARLLAPITAAYPTVTFLSGLVDVHRLPLDFVVVTVPVTAMLAGAVATASWSKWGRWAPTTALLALLWIVLVVDIVTGGRLQINTVLGYTPTIAGRFQGYGNLASALVSSTALAVAVLPLLVADQGTPRVDGSNVAPRAVQLWMAWVAAVTLIVVGAPAFGSDVGGTLTLVPVIAIVALVATGRRVSIRRLVLAVVLGVVVVCGLAAADLARPASSRTHLGRFADDVVHGEAWTIVRRKLRGNLAILTSSFWTFVLLGIFLMAAVLAWRRCQWLVERTAGRPALRIFPIGFTAMGLLGLLTNDSGIAIPAIMLGVGIPWIVAIVFPPTVRAGR